MTKFTLPMENDYVSVKEINYAYKKLERKKVHR